MVVSEHHGLVLVGYESGHGGVGGSGGDPVALERRPQAKHHARSLACTCTTTCKPKYW